MPQDPIRHNVHGRDLTVQETCTVFGCSPPTIYKLLNSGKLDSYTIGRSRRITAESVERVRQGKAGS
jgi:excisionase family DNA binding protein